MGFLDLVKSKQLPNTGSVARDHLANERTYLAWLRTSLAYTSIGVALTQLFRLQGKNLSGSPLTDVSVLQRLSRAIGGVFIVSGLILMLLGMFRYFYIQYHLEMNKFPVARGSIVAVFALTLGSIVVTLAFLLYVVK